jgi:hypothetical protein
MVYRGAMDGESSEEAILSPQIFYNALAVNILIILYAAIIAEGILLPLSTKIENRDLLATRI